MHFYWRVSLEKRSGVLWGKYLVGTKKSGASSSFADIMFVLCSFTVYISQLTIVRARVNTSTGIL